MVNQNKKIFRFADVMIITLMLFLGFITAYIPVRSAPLTGTIIAFGDSLVAGYNLAENENFVSVLSQRTGLPIINEGRIGDNTNDALARLDSDVLSKNPQMVILLLGGDILDLIPRETTFSNLRTIIDKIKATGADVLLVGVSGYPVTDYNNDFNRLAAETGVYYVPDILNGIVLNSSLTTDLIHPNLQGNIIVAERIEPVLRGALGIVPPSYTPYPSATPVPVSTPEVTAASYGSYNTYTPYSSYFHNFFYPTYNPGPQVQAPDRNPPAITGAYVSEITTGSAVVTWRTNEPSHSRLEYCTIRYHCGVFVEDNNMTLDHRIYLTGLDPGTRYYYAVYSRDSSGNMGSQAIVFPQNDLRSFVTAELPPPVYNPPVYTPYPYQYPAYTPYPPPAVHTPYPYPAYTTLYPIYTPYPAPVYTPYQAPEPLPPPSPPYDSQAPWVMRDYPSHITGTSASIYWTTNEPADGRIEYCTVRVSCGMFSASDTAFRTDHRIDLSGLTPRTRYFYWVHSRDQAGNLKVQGFRSFDTI